MGSRRANTKELRVLRSMATVRLNGGESKESLETHLTLYLVANNAAWTPRTARAFVRSFLRGLLPVTRLTDAVAATSTPAGE